MGGAVVEVKFPYVYEDVDRHGNVRVYFWRKGCRKVRLREVLGSPEFVARYHELPVMLRRPPPLAPSTDQVRALGDGYAKNTCGPHVFAGSTRRRNRSVAPSGEG